MLNCNKKKTVLDFIAVKTVDKIPDICYNYSVKKV